MKNKIALEEHFATEDTLEDSYDSIYPEKWHEIKYHIQAVGEQRLRQMDTAGIELAIVSLNAPAI